MTIQPRVLAETLFTELLQTKHCAIPPEVLIPPAITPAIDAKIRVYQFASILMALLVTTPKRPEFVPVQKHLERLFFPPMSAEGAGLLLDVRAAMNHLGELFTHKDPNHATPLYWARDWLLSAGIEQNNPVTLDLFALKWMDYYITINEAFKDFNPVS